MTTPSPELSICILSWNTEALTRDCLASLFADPRCSGWQVIVVDNNSADGSATMVAEEYPAAELIRSPKNLGFAGGNNLALTHARGKSLLLLNSDTRVPTGRWGICWTTWSNIRRWAPSAPDSSTRRGSWNCPADGPLD